MQNSRLEEVEFESEYVSEKKSLEDVEEVCESSSVEVRRLIDGMFNACIILFWTLINSWNRM